MINIEPLCSNYKHVQLAKIHGKVYVRQESAKFDGQFEPFWYRSTYTNPHAAISDYIVQSDDGEPHLICECGCQSFSIRYGNYECFATCGNCGKQDCIYSG